MKKAGVCDLYLDTIGGGERYMMSFAECLEKNDWRVDVFWDDRSIRKKIVKRLGLELDKINFVPNIFCDANLLLRRQITNNYDLIFYLSDGSIPFLFARKNIIHFQVPFHGVGGKSWLNKIKLKLIHKIVCNSQFTKKFIDREYGVSSKVVYPPIDIENLKPLKKEDMILSVGRFDSPLHLKRQDLLIEVFKKMSDQGISNWRLVLIGGSSNNRSAYLNRLRRLSSNYQIEILPNLSFDKLREYYGKAKIYWHAAGFDIDEEKEPEKVEHFGITTVEAMAAGCVPVVIKKGGQKEIVDHADNGFLWKKETDLVQYTLRLIKEEKWRQKLAFQAVKSSLKFSQEKFHEEIKQIIS